LFKSYWNRVEILQTIDVIMSIVRHRLISLSRWSIYHELICSCNNFISQQNHLNCTSFSRVRRSVPLRKVHLQSLFFHDWDPLFGTPCLVLWYKGSSISYCHFWRQYTINFPIPVFDRLHANQTIFDQRTLISMICFASHLICDLVVWTDDAPFLVFYLFHSQIYWDFAWICDAKLSNCTHAKNCEI